MTRTVTSYLCDAWQRVDHASASEIHIPLQNPATEEILAYAISSPRFAQAVEYGRRVGGPNLRAMTFGERGAMLAAMAKMLHEQREELINLAVQSGGNTRGDAKFDIDGAIAVLSSYASLAQELGTNPWLLDSTRVEVVRTSKVRAQTILMPRMGLAVQINAFNFPAWGMLGKAAVAWLAGMPVLSKPATSTSLLAHRMAEMIVEHRLVPKGAFQLVMGSVGDLLMHLDYRDVIAFTGSAGTAQSIRTHPQIVQQNVRINIEADSLNACVVAPDVQPKSELFDRLINDCVLECSQKAGQKCTATRRILLPLTNMSSIREALVERFIDISKKTGNPANPGVRMGPLATRAQLEQARQGLMEFERVASRIHGDPNRQTFIDVPDHKGYFLEPILLAASKQTTLDAHSPVHNLEVFGPVTTLLPYSGELAEAAQITSFGQGSLVTTIYSNDRDFTRKAVEYIAPHVGRLVLMDEKSAAGAFSPGCVFPQVHHGGPGRAGGGEELGGRHGLRLYMQRTTLQAGDSQLARLVQSDSP